MHFRTNKAQFIASLYDENKLCVSYLQPKFTKVSIECVSDSRKQYAYVIFPITYVQEGNLRSYPAWQQDVGDDESVCT